MLFPRHSFHVCFPSVQHSLHHLRLSLFASPRISVSVCPQAPPLIPPPLPQQPPHTHTHTYAQRLHACPRFPSPARAHSFRLRLQVQAQTANAARPLICLAWYQILKSPRYSDFMYQISYLDVVFLCINILLRKSPRCSGFMCQIYCGNYFSKVFDLVILYSKSTGANKCSIQVLDIVFLYN